jgi:L-fucose isomerase
VAKIGVLTFSDGREFVHRDVLGTNERFQTRLANRLAADGHEVVIGDVVWSAESARSQARRLVQEGCDATIFNYAVWAFPHFTAMASQIVPRPIIAFSKVNPQLPALSISSASPSSVRGATSRTRRPSRRYVGSVAPRASSAACGARRTG